MTGNLLILILLVSYFVDYAFGFEFPIKRRVERDQDTALQIPSDYNNLRVPKGRPPVDEASHSCVGSLCPNNTIEPDSSATVPDVENTTILPTLVAGAGENENKPPSSLTTTTEHVTILPTVQISSKTPIGDHGDTNQFTATTSSTEAAMDSTELPTTKINEAFPRLGGNEEITETTSSIIPPTVENFEDSKKVEVPPLSSPIVDVALQIQSIREIEETDQKIVLDVDLMVHWHDYRIFPIPSSSRVEHSLSDILIKYERIQMNDSDYSKLWKPDIFIERVDKITKPELMSNSHSIRYIGETASIIYTTRASIKLDCSMSFVYYPADTQNCILDIRSYQSDERKMQLRWNPGAYLVDPDTDDNFDLKLAHVVRKKKRMHGFHLKEVVYDVLQLQLSMRRRMTYHLLQTYVPSAFLVVITWLSFLIPEELIEGRIGISMTTLLTLTAMFSSVRENTPVVSYVKAIDIWMAYCIITVFSTLLEFTFFIWLRNFRIGKKRKRLESMMSVLERGEDRTKKSKNMILGLGGSGAENSLQSGNVRRQSSIADDITSKAAQAFENTANIFNHFAFGFFVLGFLVFNISYWTWLIVYSKHYEWKVDPRLNGGGDPRFGFIGETEYFTNHVEPSTVTPSNNSGSGEYEEYDYYYT